MDRSELTDLLTPAAAPGTRMAVRELVAAGVPRRHAESMSRATRAMTTSADVAEVVDRFAARLAEDEERERVTDPAALARHVSRL